MCGVIGVVGNENIMPTLLHSLRKLEYRGYDSAGIATLNGGHVIVRKGVGSLDRVEHSHRLSELEGTVGIGHVRWATHGGVNEKNAHPHFDCQRRIAVVHNGIIENYQELRAELSKRHTFTSETDTEVIAHLIEEGLMNGAKLEHAVHETIKKLRGSYALLAISSHDPGTIVAARKDSPLVVGVGNGRNFIASDTLCFAGQTDQVIYVQDNETVVLTDKYVRVLDESQNLVERLSERIDSNLEDVTKQDHPYFMLKEILEQPLTIRRAAIQDSKLIMDIAMEILRARNVIFTACGTSRHAALIGRYVFSRLGGKFSDVINASEFQYFSDSVDKSTLVVAVSQSGETADVIAGVKEAKERGARIISLVNVVGSTLARLSDQALYLQCGPEIAVAATKSFTGQLVIFYELAFAMMNRLESGLTKIKSLSHHVEANLKLCIPSLTDLANDLKYARDFYFLGRGINFAVAAEGALKLKEVAYVHAEGMPAGELKHGTLALIDSETPVIAICPADSTFNDTLSNVAETKARGGYVVGVSDRDNPLFDRHIIIPEVEEIFYPLVSIPPLQFLAYHSAVARNLNPDRPRHLAKSVTVK